MNGVTELALLSLLRAWNRERDASIVVGFNGRGEIQIREGDLFLSPRREVPEGLTDDGVIRDFLLVLVAEDENRRRGVRLLWIASWRLSIVARIEPTRIGIVLAICILLLAHSGFRYILLVPLTGHLKAAVIVAVEAVIVIIPRTPHRGIVVAPTPAPSASPAYSAPIGVKVVSAEGAEAIRKLIATSSNVEMTASPR